MNQPVVTRFAPSPTGYLHIGGARTALFNWLFARHHGGRFRLRIEDTDRARSTQDAVDALIDGLKWLGLHWDDEIIYQFSRAQRHREVALELVEKGLAYRCYMSIEELEALREAARQEGKPFRYDGRWRDRDPAEAVVGVSPVIRLKAPQTGTTLIDDRVQGRVEWANKDLDDLVLLRSDGTPTYMLSVVVDDHDMGVTHIIRGDDHLTNAARQKQIYEALGWDVPIMAHIPLIHGPDGAKLSKRHGALGVDAYRVLGYLPAGLQNYLARLGWSHGDQEFFSIEDMVALFDLNHVGKSPSRLDFAKLGHVNAHHMRNMPSVDLLQSLRGLMPLEGLEWLEQHGEQALLMLLPAFCERSQTLVEVIEAAGLLWRQINDRDAKAQEALNTVLPLLPDLQFSLQNLEATQWSTDALKDLLQAFLAKKGLKMGQLGPGLRSALFGTTQTPSLDLILAALGREETLNRLSKSILQ